jgi:hypothetical protein
LLIAGVAVVVFLAAAAVVADVVMFAQKPTPAAAAAPVSTPPAAPTPDPTLTADTTTTPTPDTTTGAAPTPTDNARVQAQQIDDMLQRSASARGGIAPALTNIANCRTSPADIEALEYAAQVREQLVTEIAAQDMTSLPNAERLRSILASLWQASIDADYSYLNWADSNTCDGSTDPNQVEGDAYSETATRAKTAFLAAWNPIAKKYGLPQRDQSQI